MIESSRKFKEKLGELSEIISNFSKDLHQFNKQDLEMERSKVLAPFEENITSGLKKTLDDIFHISDDCIFSNYSKIFKEISNSFDDLKNKFTPILIDPLKMLYSTRDEMDVVKKTIIKTKELTEKYSSSSKKSAKEKLEKNRELMVGTTTTWLGNIVETFLTHKTKILNHVNLFTNATISAINRKKFFYF